MSPMPCWVVIWRPAAANRGPMTSPASMASRTAVAMPRGPPGSHAVVTPAASTFAASTAARIARYAGGVCSDSSSSLAASPKLMCMWASRRPGSTVAPAASITFVDWRCSSGSSAVGPTQAMRSPSVTTDPALDHRPVEHT